MINFKQRLVSIFLCFFILSTSYFSFYKSTKAYADSLPSLSTDLMAQNEDGSFTPTVQVPSPYNFVVTTASMAAGAVYKTRAQINSFVTGAVDYLNSLGQGIGTGIRKLNDGVGYITSQAKTLLIDYMTKIQDGLYQLTSFVRDWVVGAGETVWTTFKVTLHEAVNFTLDSVWNPSNTDVVFKVGSNVFSGSLRNGFVGISYANGYYWLGNYGKLPSSYRGETVSIGFNNRGSFKETISVDHVLNPNSSIVVPRDGAISYGDSAFSSNDTTKVTNSGITNWDSINGKTGSDVIGGGVIVDNVTEKEMEEEIKDTTPPDSGNGNGVGDLDTDVPEKVELDFSPLYLNLATKFPFCIPFDLVNSIKSFQSNKVPPRWEVNFDKGLVGSASFVVDFSNFEKLILIIRYFSLLAYVVFLIVKTRDLIKG